MREREATPEFATRPASPTVVTAVSSPRWASDGEADQITTLEKIKPQVASMGVDGVSRQIDLLG